MQEKQEEKGKWKWKDGERRENVECKIMMAAEEDESGR